jgi:predicted RNA-binding protein YlxR (DUF448 family)
MRLVRTGEGQVEIDITGKKEGRGAYICRDRACWEKVLKSRQLEHALKAKINQQSLERLVEDGKKLLKEPTVG